MRKKTQYIVVNEIYKTIYCGYPQKRAWKIITGSSGGMPVASYEFTFENEPTTVELTKTDLTNGKELPGAHLRLDGVEVNANRRSQAFSNRAAP